MITADGFRRAMEHERFAMQTLRTAFLSVPAERRDDPAYQKALEKLAHIVATRETWLHRVGALETMPDAVFPDAAPLDELALRAASIQARWEAWAEELDDDDLGEMIEYRSTEGVGWRNTLGALLMHVYTHSFHHRGQINLLLTSCGGTAGLMDLILFDRERC
ncbi:MAG: DinB family protein [Planctomycetota bacterium]